MTPPPGVKEVSAGYGELALGEMPAIDLLTSLGWSFKNLYAETFGELGSEGRESETQVILTRRLRAALLALNPGLPVNFRRGAPESQNGTKLAPCASLPCPP
jgi:type I restriction enzyme R subunit